MSTAGSGPVIVKRQEAVFVPNEEARSLIALRKMDWGRIKRSLSKVQSDESQHAVWYSILFGIAGGAALSLISLAASKDVPALVWAIHACVAVAALLLAFIVLKMEGRAQRTRRVRVTEILEDMQEVEKACEHPEAAAESSAGSAGTPS